MRRVIIGFFTVLGVLVVLLVVGGAVTWHFLAPRTPAIAGSTNFDSTIQAYRMTAGGINLWGASDQFQYAWNKIKGDFISRKELAERLMLGVGAGV